LNDAKRDHHRKAVEFVKQAWGWQYATGQPVRPLGIFGGEIPASGTQCDAPNLSPFTTSVPVAIFGECNTGTPLAPMGWARSPGAIWFDRVHAAAFGVHGSIVSSILICSSLKPARLG